MTPDEVTPGRLDALARRLEAVGQGHVLRHVDRLAPAALSAFCSQLEALDLPRLAAMAAEVLDDGPRRPPGAIGPPEMAELGEGDEHRARDATARARGEALLAEGKVAAFLVAGGQGTRLGFPGPKGRFPIGPLTGRSLFAYHAHRVLATRRRYGARAPLYVMTSDATHASTVAAFDEAGHFGLDPEDVVFLRQGTLPALDRQGRLLLQGPGTLALSPDGHGGCFAALGRSGALDDMARRGVEQIFYFQVDNPLARVLDPVFIGLHAGETADMSTKVVAKTDPAEKVGLVARVGRRTTVIEYSDLDPSLAAERDGQGRLRLRAGNIAIHMLSLPFVERLLGGRLQMPVHRALKRVPCLDEHGRTVEPAEPNAIKLELFVFDALPLADRTVTQEVRREDEFAPVKNAEGVDSPETARALLSAQARRWMAGADLAPPRDAAEVGPLFALDAEEFRRNLTGREFGPVFDRS